MITYRHFNDTQTADRSLYNQFRCPSVGGLFHFRYAERVCAYCPEGTEVAHRESKEISDYARGQPIAKQRVPRKRSGARGPASREPTVQSARRSAMGREEK